MADANRGAGGRAFTQAAQKIVAGVSSVKTSDGLPIVDVFSTLPDRRIPGYYQIVKRPMALDILKQNLNDGKYAKISEFVRDFAQIVYNAKLFNEKGSEVYEYAVLLEKYLRQQLSSLRGKFDSSELAVPNIGGLLKQESDDEAYEDGESGEDDDNDDDDDDNNNNDNDDEDNEDNEDDDDDALLPRKRGRPRRSNAVDDEDTGRKRSRPPPPATDRPHEVKIKAIMRGLRKERDPKGDRLLYLTFEKLPDASQFPDYYNTVAHPISIDRIRKNIKRGRYASVEAFVADVDLLLNNAKQYYAEGSGPFKDATQLQAALASLTGTEAKTGQEPSGTANPNAKFTRVPIDHIEHMGGVYRVGDWVHIRNPNDESKPIIGQIFRIWAGGDGQQWVNVCWYYRPEQTVHRYDKVFYENEVVKSGQYRDHHVDEIQEKCFVMFITKYQRGRPAGVGSRSVYCCESRYNEVEKAFNKIRTWKACIPDEVRMVDYPMDMYEKPIAIRRVPSPIKHLLPVDARDTDPIPDPVMGAPNAPPVVGAVYKRRPDPNEPVETPSPDTGEPSLFGAPPRNMPKLLKAAPAGVSALSPPLQPQNSASAAAALVAARYGRSLVDQSPRQHLPQLSSPRTPVPSSPGAIASPGPNYRGIRGVGAYTPGTPGGPANNVPAAALQPSTAFTLPPSVSQLTNEAELEHVAHVDKTGQVMWFSAPPLWVPHRKLAEPLPAIAKLHVKQQQSTLGPEPAGQPVVKAVRPRGLGHSAKYMAYKLRKMQEGS